MGNGGQNGGFLAFCGHFIPSLNLKNPPDLKNFHQKIPSLYPPEITDLGQPWFKPNF